MSISIKNIRVVIDGVQSSGFDIEIGGVMFRLDTFSLSQNLLSPNSLSFTMHKKPDEDIQEAQFVACGLIMGKEIELGLDTENIEQLSFNVEKDNTDEVSFKGVIISASGSRERTSYTIYVQAVGYEALLDDNPSCRSFENKTLDEIIGEIVSDYSEHLDVEINPRFTEPVP